MNHLAPDSVACRISTVAENIAAGQAWRGPAYAGNDLNSLEVRLYTSTLSGRL